MAVVCPKEATASAAHALDSTDVVEFVLARLEVKELAAAAQVCRQWRAASLTAADAWRRAFVETFGSELKGADYPQQPLWRDNAALLDNAYHKLRSKARFLDEMEDSLQAVLHNYDGLLDTHRELLSEACDEMEPEAAEPSNEEQEQLLAEMSRLKQSLSYLQSCVDEAAADVAGLQRRRAHLQAATEYRPNVPSS